MDKVDVRMGIAHFGDTGADNTSGQWVPLKPTCDMPEPAQWTSSRSTFMSAVNGFHFNKEVPLARALLDVGQYYHTSSLPWFSLGTTWNAGTGGSTNQQSICYSCQVSSTIVLVDRAPGPSDGNALPVGTVAAGQTETEYAGSSEHRHPRQRDHGRVGDPAESVPRLCGLPGREGLAEQPHPRGLVSAQLRPPPERGVHQDCAAMGGKQLLDIYTIGLGATGDSSTMLESMAEMGGGDFKAADDAPTLRRSSPRRSSPSTSAPPRSASPPSPPSRPPPASR